MQETLEKKTESNQNKTSPILGKIENPNKLIDGSDLPRTVNNRARRNKQELKIGELNWERNRRGSTSAPTRIHDDFAVEKEGKVGDNICCNQRHVRGFCHERTIIS